MILFHTNQTNINISNRRAIKSWIGDLLQKYRKTPGEIGIIFCTSEYMLDLNKRFLKHDNYTDVITFNYSDNKEKRMSGDIFIDHETVFYNAARFGQEKHVEILRVIAHGLLHMLGYDDDTEESRDNMHRLEDNALKEIQINPLG